MPFSDQINRKSKIVNRKSKIVNRKSKIVNRKSKIVNRKSKIVNRKSKIQNRKSKIVNRKSNRLTKHPSAGHFGPIPCIKCQADVPQISLAFLGDPHTGTPDFYKSIGCRLG